MSGDTPVRTVGDHVVESDFSPFRIESRGFNSFQGDFAKNRFFFNRLADPFRVSDRLIHSDKPLVSCSVDQRCLMTPAVHVAVHDFAAGQQIACDGDRVENLVFGFPDV